MSWPQTGATHYHAQLGIRDNDRAIKGFIMCNDWNLEPLDLALVCYQLSPEV